MTNDEKRKQMREQLELLWQHFNLPARKQIIGARFELTWFEDRDQRGFAEITEFGVIVRSDCLLYHNINQGPLDSNSKETSCHVHLESEKFIFRFHSDSEAEMSSEILKRNSSKNVQSFPFTLRFFE